ncbi:hypothetical protein [Brevifollis gellanilyticus]|uniref:Uncharacterized protein n=1 Tax=Brevifollis gellanilyticus TaxID=748831 RepID=A0A512M8U1_9BACT|nr:hypothetical protein [Brevifollis gellanilyticus]GEP43135.1 hypothetical protein BGE01nite_24260 [Brevifollis gellanilyticus]
MIVTYESVMSSAMQLGPEDRRRLASNLWESVHSLTTEANGTLEGVLDERETELEKDPSLEISHEAFICHFSRRHLA